MEKTETENKVEYICKIKESDKNIIINLYNVNVANFNYSLDTYGKTHTMRGHSGSDRKLRECEIPVTEDDFSNLKKYIEKSVELVGAGISRSRKLPTVMHIFDAEDFNIYIVFEILNKKKELRLKTMYKNKKYFYQQGS